MPRDRLAAMQQQAYIEDGDDFAVQMQEAMDGKNYVNQYHTYPFLKIRVCQTLFNLNHHVYLFCIPVYS